MENQKGHDFNDAYATFDMEELAVMCGAIVGAADGMPVIEPVVPPRDEARRKLQQQENEAINAAGINITPPNMPLQDMVADCVAITIGSRVGIMSMPGVTFSTADFVYLTESCLTERADKKGKFVKTARLWRDHAERKTVLTQTFHAGAGVICQDPDGKSALNSWRPIIRWDATEPVDVQPFLDHIAYLFVDKVEREKFLDWLAHIEQKPGELPHFGWIHIAKNTGTGRNWLASVLARVWRGYVAPNVDLPALLESPYNGALAGRILAMVDEVQEGAGDNPYRHANRLKALVNAEYRDVNPKCDRQYREHNACRWLTFSNHENALPLKGDDRRFRVVMHSAEPRKPEVYAELYGMLDNPEFINGIAAYLRNRDITGFNPGERPPMNEAKRAAVNAAKSTMLLDAEMISRDWPVDVIDNRDVEEVLTDDFKHKVTTAQQRRVMVEVGAAQYQGGRKVKIGSQSSRIWILRNLAKWMGVEPAEIAREANKARIRGDQKAADVLACNPLEHVPLM